MTEHLNANDAQEPAGAPPGTLARRFVQMLLADLANVGLQQGSPKDDLFLPDLSEFGLDAEEPEQKAEAKPLVLPIDMATVAVLLASGFEKAPHVLRSLRKDAPVVGIHLPEKDLGAMYESVLKVCAFGRSTRILDMTSYSLACPPALSGKQRTASILYFDGIRSATSKDRSRNDGAGALALSLAVPVCVLSSDPTRAVPDVVRRALEDEIPVCGWTNVSLSVVVEAVTGEAATVPDGAWIRSVSLDDLRTSVSFQRGAAASVDRLRDTVTRRLATGDKLGTLEEMPGFGKARTVGLEMLSDIVSYRDGRIPWSEVPRGMVLVGPPGVGKSLFARVFARSAKLPLITASLAQWQSSGGGYLGDCLSAMRKSFQEAKAAAPSVLFIDELDSIGDRASFDSRHRDYSVQVLNALLEELDGAAERVGVFVMGATNLLHRIDPAIIRPGRFDRVVRIDLPEPPELAEILRACLGSDAPDADLLPAAIAGRGGAGADAASWSRRARGIARRAGRTVTVDDLMTVIREDRKALPEDVRWRIACHEAGHAVALLALQLGTLDSLTIHDRGGTTSFEAAPIITTPDVAMRDLVHLLAGRAGEVVVTGTPSAGIGGNETSDIACATRIALQMETSWGFSAEGPIWLGESEATSTAFAASSYAPRTRRILLHAQEEAERLVRAHEDVVRRLARRLLDAGHLDGEEVTAVAGDLPRFEVRQLPPRPALVTARAS